MLAFLLSLVMLGLAALQDLKEREVSDELWYFFGVIGTLWIVLDNYTSILALSRIAINIGLTVILMYTIHFMGKKSSFFYIGGGDLKAIMALAFVNWQLHWTYFATVFIISLALVLIVPLALLTLNLISKPTVSKQLKKHKFALYLLGRKTKITGLTNAFYTPLEDITIKNGKEVRRLSLAPNVEAEKMFQRLKKLVKEKKIKNSIWVSPLLPHIFFIILAYVFTITFDWNIVNVFI
ncbi:MAG: hypothetical protein GOV15_04680 [Candidatus Diapherotrites archaeon]|nr:hypothetical protein [Candidatus Diapherotrites archaeon]